MAELTLLFKPTPAQIDALVLDASISEQHMSAVEITEHPVEDGANISDHARAKPDQVTIEGLISNTPIGLVQERRIAASLGSTDLEKPGYAEQAYLKLLDLKNTQKLVTIVTAIRTYDDMVLQSLTVPRSAREGDALRFTATFKHVIRVKNKVTEVTVAREPKAKKKVSTGKQSTKDAGTAGEAAYTSVLFDIAQAFGGVPTPDSVFGRIVQ